MDINFPYRVLPMWRSLKTKIEIWPVDLTHLYSELNQRVFCVFASRLWNSILAGGTQYSRSELGIPA